LIALKEKAERIGNEGYQVSFSHEEKEKNVDEIDELEAMLARMVEKIRLRDQRYEAVVATQSELILRMKPDGTFTFFNPAVSDYFSGLEHKNLTMVADEYIQPSDREEIQSLINNILPTITKENPFRSLDVPVLREDGEERCIQWNVTVIFDQEDEIQEFQAVGRDITELKAIHAQLDDANQQLHQLSHTLLNEREKDRAGLARELHDEILNYISELFMSADNLPSDSSQEIYQKIVDKIRGTIYELRPPMLNYGLYFGLEDLVDGITERFGSEVEIKLDVPSSDIRFDPDVEIQLFRIIQEACGNALLHADASILTIKGEINPEHVLISVEDNGSGFEYVNGNEGETLLSNKHFGLVGMRERAGLIDAILLINTRLGEGTTIVVEWLPSEELV